MRIFKILNAPASIELVTDDIINVDGSTSKDELVDSFLVYEWDSRDTCLPGCYWMEFKLIKEVEPDIVEPMALLPPSTTPPSFTPSTFSEETFGCKLGTGVEWVRRFPVEGEGFLIKIIDSPTAEL